MLLLLDLALLEFSLLLFFELVDDFLEGYWTLIFACSVVPSVLGNGACNRLCVSDSRTLDVH